jgi:ribosome-binding factor A
MVSQKSVKVLRTESVLRELVSEAIGSLNDTLINSIGVTDVMCSKGKSDATVFLLDLDYTDSQKRVMLANLKKASGAIGAYCLAAEGWYKMPSLTFKFDDTIDKMQKMEKLFNEIRKKNGE